ncbi:MAG: hypothetical protein ACI9C3_002422 [Yoonia sp.]
MQHPANDTLGAGFSDASRAVWVARKVAWRRRSAQAGNRGVGSWWVSGVYRDLWVAGALGLTSQDAFAGFVRSDLARVLLVFRRYALFAKDPGNFCATLP